MGYMVTPQKICPCYNSQFFSIPPYMVKELIKFRNLKEGIIWIILVDVKCNPEYPYKRQVEEF